MRYYEIIREDGRIVPGVNTTKDVQPGEIKRQGKKFGFDVSAEGTPPLVSKDSGLKTTEWDDPALDVQKVEADALARR